MSISWDEALDRVRQVAAVCVESDLERLRVEEEPFSLEVRRTRRLSASLAKSETDLLLPEHPHDPAASAFGQNGAAHTPEEVLLKADFVGILRFSRPVVSEGSMVSEEREPAYIESLGTRNPVRVSGHGRITAVYVTDGQAVDYGHPIFGVAYE